MISVCIPTYNGSEYIYQQVSSILVQLDSNDEIIISDDESTDNTLDILHSFNDNRIKIFSHKDSYKSKFKFNQVTRNMQNALLNASGDIIFFADQDDIWVENKVKICKKALESNHMILHDCIVVNNNNQQLYPSYFDLIGSKSGILKNMIKNSYLGCCMAMKKSVLETALPFPEKEIPHDIWIGLIAEKFGKVSFLNEKLVRYRRHGNNLSASGGKNSNTFLFKLKYRFVILQEFLKKVRQIKSTHDESFTIR